MTTRTRPQVCPRCQSEMEEGTMSAWHPDSFQPITDRPTMWRRLFNRTAPGPRAWRCPLCFGFQVDQPPNPVAEDLRRRRYIQPCRWTIAAAWIAAVGAYAFFLIDALAPTVGLGLLCLALAAAIPPLSRACHYPNTATLLRLYVYLALSFLVYMTFYVVAPARIAVPASRLYAFVSGLYITATALATYRAFNHPPRIKTTSHVCAGCGYLLYCLTQPRCPECGRHFNPALVVPTSPRPRIHTPPRFK